MNDHESRVIEAQVREAFGRLVYTHKTHEKDADLALERLGRIKLAQIVLSTLTTTAILASLFGKSQWVLAVGALISTALVGLNAYTKDYDLGEIAQKHKDAATKLWSVRESYISLLTDLRLGGMELAKAQELRDDLQKRLEAIYPGAPTTTARGYKAAQKALKVNEDLTFTDAEIDTFLPSELRRTERSALGESKDRTPR